MKRIGEIGFPHLNREMLAGYWEAVRSGAPASTVDEETGERICATCGGTGYIRYDLRVDHPKFGQMFPCPANCSARQTNEARALGTRRKYTMLPPEYQGLTFESFNHLPTATRNGKMVAAHAAWMFATNAVANHMIDFAELGAMFGRVEASDCRNWLYLYGPRGVGKTGLAAAIINAITPDGYAALYIRLQDAFAAIQSRYDRANPPTDEFGDRTADEVLELFKRARLLVIDEFDVPGTNEDKRSKVENMIRYRHGQVLPTVITTNLSQREFEQKWGATTASVVWQRSHVIEMSGLPLRAPARTFGGWE